MTVQEFDVERACYIVTDQCFYNTISSCIPTQNVIIIKIIIYFIHLYGATKCQNRDVKQLALKNCHYEAPSQRLVNTHARIYRYIVYINELRIYRYGNLATICYRFVMILVCSTTDDVTNSIIAELSGVFPFYSFSAKYSDAKNSLNVYYLAKGHAIIVTAIDHQSKWI